MRMTGMLLVTAQTLRSYAECPDAQLMSSQVAM